MGRPHNPHPSPPLRSAECSRGINDSPSAATLFARRTADPAPRHTSWRRFERYAPNDLWQIDGTQVALADGSAGWVIDILDDHARFAIGATATRRFTATAARRAMETAITEHGAPRQLISDNGIQFISRDGHQPVHFQSRMRGDTHVRFGGRAGE
jgi:transposase InsO family protein